MVRSKNKGRKDSGVIRAAKKKQDDYKKRKEEWKKIDEEWEKEDSQAIKEKIFK